MHSTQSRKDAKFLAFLFVFYFACKSHGAHDPVWKIRLEGRTYADLLVDRATFFAFSQAGEIIAAGVNEGKKIWSRKIDDAIVSTPYLYKDALYVATQNGTVMRLRRENGAIEWQRPLNQTIIAPLNANDRLLVVPSETGSLYTLDPRDGKEIWHLSGFRKFSAAPILIGNRILIGTWDRRFLCLKDDGAIDWSFQMPDIVAEGAVTLKDRLFVSAYDHYVYALQIQTGKLMWRFPANRPSNLVLLSRSPAGEALVFASGTHLVLVSPTSGKQLRRLKFGKVISRIYSQKSDLYVIADNVYRVDPAKAKISVAIDAPNPIYKLSFATGMNLAIDDIYSIYGYAPVQD